MSDIEERQSNLQLLQLESSDTIAQFMEKCNLNFAEIVAKGGGPQGLDGKNGKVGPTGKSGNKIWTNDFELDEDNPNYNDAIQSTDDDYQDGDLVWFSKVGAIGSIKVTKQYSNGNEIYVKNIDNVKSLIGKQGKQGETGDKASDQLEGGNDGWVSKVPITVPKLISDNGIIIGEEEDSSFIKELGSEFVISTKLDKLTLKTKNDGTINIDSKDVNIKGSSTINLNGAINVDGVLKVNDTLIQTNSNGKSNIKTETISVETINATDIISTNKLTVTNECTLKNPKFQGTTNFSEIGNTSGVNLNISSSEQLNLTGNGGVSLYSSTNHVNINNSISAVSGKIYRYSRNADVPIVSGTEIKATIGDDKEVYLGTPLYTLMLNPVYAKVPQHYIAWTEPIVIKVKQATVSNITKNENKYLKLQAGQNVFEIEDIFQLDRQIENVSVVEVENRFGVVVFGEGNKPTWKQQNTQTTQSNNSTSTYYGSATAGSATADADISTDFNDDIPSVIIPNNPGEQSTTTPIAKFVKHMLFSGSDSVLVKPDNVSVVAPSMEDLLSGTSFTIDTLTIQPPTSPTGFEWIFKYE